MDQLIKRTLYWRMKNNMKALNLNLYY